MKILITTDCYLPVINGVVTSVVNLKKELQRLGHEIRVLTLSEEAKSYTDHDVTYISSLSINKIYPGARVSLFKNYKYMKEIIEWQPDIVHSQCEFSTFRLAKQISKHLRIPIIHTYHTVYEDYTHYFSPNQKWGEAMVAIFSRKVLQHATYVIAPTKKVSNLLHGYGVNPNIYIIPTGIDLSSFKQKHAAQGKNAVRRQLNIPEENHVLLFVGRLAKEKKLEVVLSYFSRMKLQNITLLVVGDGPYRSYLEASTRKLHIEDKVIFTGMVLPQDITRYYQAADIFVNASKSETQGLTYIEALASGLPALCRKDPCLENVIENGVNGWLFETFDEFKTYMEKILIDKNTYETLSFYAKKKAYDNYSSIAFAKNVENLYKDALTFYHQENARLYLKHSEMNL